MGNCLCCCDNKARQVELDLENSLRAVASVFPGTHYCVIVTPGGDTRCVDAGLIEFVTAWCWPRLCLTCSFGWA